MSRLNYLVRDPISFVGITWRTTAHLVCGRVFTMLYRSHDRDTRLEKPSRLTSLDPFSRSLIHLVFLLWAIPYN